MRKLLLAITLLLCSVGFAQAQNVILQLPHYNDVAIDCTGDNPVYYRVICEEVGQDVKYRLLDEYFRVVHEFTVKGINTQSQSGSYISESASSYEVYATKGIFTKDNKWCVCTWERNDSYPDSKSFIYNESGEKLFELPKDVNGYEEGYLMSAGVPKKGKYYYLLEQEDYYEVYDFVDNSGVITPTVIAQTSRVYPNPLPQGSMLTVELPREADNNTSLSVTDASGRQIYHTRVRPGLTSVKVNAGHPSRGMLIYTIAFGDGTTESGKLLAE